MLAPGSRETDRKRGMSRCSDSVAAGSDVQSVSKIMMSATTNIPTHIADRQVDKLQWAYSGQSDGNYAADVLSGPSHCRGRERHGKAREQQVRHNHWNRVPRIDYGGSNRSYSTDDPHTLRSTIVMMRTALVILTFCIPVLAQSHQLSVPPGDNYQNTDQGHAVR